MNFFLMIFILQVTFFKIQAAEAKWEKLHSRRVLSDRSQRKA